MQGIVQNEYVHVDRVDRGPWPIWLVSYEPLDRSPFKGTLKGTIYRCKGNGSIYQCFFHAGTNENLLIDSVDILSGHCGGNVIVLEWRKVPPREHFLQVSYEFGEPETHNWLKEGF